MQQDTTFFNIKMLKLRFSKKTVFVYKVDVPDEQHMEEDEDILNYDDLDDPDTFV